MQGISSGLGMRPRDRVNFLIVLMGGSETVVVDQRPLINGWGLGEVPSSVMLGLVNGYIEWIQMVDNYTA